MLAQERQQIILDMLQANRSIKISDIVDQFGISTLTARRDLDVLEARKLVHRVYGGAILEEPTTAATQMNPLSPNLVQPERERSNRKKAIAKTAAAIVKEYDTVFLGNGVLIAEIAHCLRHFSHLTIITSSLTVINEMAATNNKIIVLGGTLGPGEPSIHGSSALDMLRNFCADKAFISCMGVSPEFGVTSDFIPTVEVGRLMVEQSAHPMLVCSSSRYGLHKPHVVCPVSRLEAIVIDDGLSAEQQKALEMAGTKVLVASTREKDSTNK